MYIVRKQKQIEKVSIMYSQTRIISAWINLMIRKNNLHKREVFRRSCGNTFYASDIEYARNIGGAGLARCVNRGWFKYRFYNGVWGCKRGARKMNQYYERCGL